MDKGFGMWIMSKLVMFIFLFSLVAALGAYYMIYQNKVVDDTAKKFTQSIAEDITNVLSYKSDFKSIWLDSGIWVRDTSRSYTLYLEYVPGKDLKRIVIFMTWNDHPSIENVSFSAASAVSLVSGTKYKKNYLVSTVCLYNITSNGVSEIPMGSNGLVIRPSNVKGYRNDYILIYKFNNKLCIGTKTNDVDLQDAMDKLKIKCEKKCGYT